MGRNSRRTRQRNVSFTDNPPELAVEMYASDPDGKEEGACEA